MALVQGGYASRQGRALQLVIRNVLQNDGTLFSDLNTYTTFWSYDSAISVPPTYNMLIDYAPYVDISTVTTTNNVLMNQDTMSFQVTLNEELPTPRVGMEVIWRLWDYDSNTEINREYGGVITSVSEESFGTSLVYNIGCNSYLRWFDRKLITGYYQQQPPEVTIEQIISKYCAGFTTNNVKASNLYLVPQYFNYQRPSQAVKLLADQVQRGWYIDYYRDLHFFRYEDFSSPLPGNILDVENDVTNYGNLVLSEDGEQIYNRFTIRGYKERSATTYTLNFVADGTSHQWSLGYRVSSAKGDVVVKVTRPDDSVWYPAVKRDVLDGIPGQGGDPSVVYVHYTQHLIRFANAPEAGTQIEVTFYYLVDKKQTDQFDTSVEYMKAIEGDPAGDGVYHYATFDKSLTNSTMASVRQKIEILSLKYGTPTVVGSFTSYTHGWRAGQSFRITSTRRMGGITPQQPPAGTVGLGGLWYVHKVSKKWIQPAQLTDPNNPTSYNGNPIQYEVEFANKPYMV